MLPSGQLPASLRRRWLAFEFVGEFLDYRIGENLASDPLHLGFGHFLLNRWVKGEDEVLALANVCHALVIHLFQSSLDGFALGVENRSLESDVDVGFHWLSRIDYTGGPGSIIDMSEDEIGLVACRTR